MELADWRPWKKCTSAVSGRIMISWNFYVRIRGTFILISVEVQHSYCKLTA
jgi:hypothetical protein